MGLGLFLKGTPVDPKRELHLLAGTLPSLAGGRALAGTLPFRWWKGAYFYLIRGHLSYLCSSVSSLLKTF